MKISTLSPLPWDWTLLIQIWGGEPFSPITFPLFFQIPTKAEASFFSFVSSLCLWLQWAFFVPFIQEHVGAVVRKKKKNSLTMVTQSHDDLQGLLWPFLWETTFQRACVPIGMRQQFSPTRMCPSQETTQHITPTAHISCFVPVYLHSYQNKILIYLVVSMHKSTGDALVMRLLIIVWSVPLRIPLS